MSQTDILIKFTEMKNQIIDILAVFLTFLGNEEFYFIIIPFIWGYLAAVVRTKAFTIFAIILILLISISRLYAGLHWPIDIVAGIFIGLCFVGLGILFQEKISRLPRVYKWVLVVTVPLLLLVWFPDGEEVQYAGVLLGASIGYFAQNRFVQMEIDKRVWRKIIAFVIGLWITCIAPYLFIKTGVYRKVGASHS